MNCASCERNLSAYIDDELSVEMRLEIEAHLDECASCRKEFEAHQTVWETANLAWSGGASDRLWEGIEERVKRKSGSGTSLEDLGLMLRGLAGEVRDLRRSMEALQREVEEMTWGEEREGKDEIRVQRQRFGGSPFRPASIERLRRTS